MIATGLPDAAAPVPARTPPRTASSGDGARSSDTSETTAVLAAAEETADRSQTARRDALSQELQRLITVARKLNGKGELRSNADAMQKLAQQIAKVARALADAERALPPSQRRGVSIAGFAAAPPAAAASDDADDDNTGPAGGSSVAGPDPIPQPAGSTPTDRTTGTDRGRGIAAAAERTDASGSDHSGTVTLLRDAAGLLDKIRETVEAAERLERLIDPEAAGKRGAAKREVAAFAVELRGLAGALDNPQAGIDLRA